MVFEPEIIPNELLINLPNFFSVESLIILSDKINFSKAPESRIDFINLSPSCSISAKIATASPPAAARTDTSFERSVLFIFMGTLTVISTLLSLSVFLKFLSSSFP